MAGVAQNTHYGLICISQCHFIQRINVCSPHWPSLERRVRRSCVIVGSWGDIPAVLGSHWQEAGSSGLYEARSFFLKVEADKCDPEE